MSLFYVWYSITYLAWYALLSGEIQGGDSSKNTIKQPDDVIGNEITGHTKKIHEDLFHNQEPNERFMSYHGVTPMLFETTTFLLNSS